MDITGSTSGIVSNVSGAFSAGDNLTLIDKANYFGYSVHNFQASKSWTGATSNASPYTNPLGSGTALNIQPAYITLKFWKRLS